MQFDQRLDGFVTKFERGDHHIFGDFIRAAFDHEDGVFRAGDAQIKVGCLDFGVGRVDDELAVDASHAHRADGSVPGDI